MSFVRIASVLVLCGTFVFSASTAQAFHGYPPYGAWAYGSAHYPAARVVRTSTVYRLRPHAYGWGGYGNFGYSATTRVRYHGIYRPYAFHHTPRLAYTVAYPRYVFPRYTYIASPVISLSSVVYPAVVPYYFPTCSVPSVYSTGYTTDLFRSQPYGTTTSIHLITDTRITQPTSRSTAFAAHSVLAADTNRSSQLVSTPHSVENLPVAVPQILLEAADSILRAGGYAEAATAYAQLSVRFGSNPTIFGRRFIAQVASGNLDQAEVIVELAELLGTPIRQEDLPGGSLVGLLRSPIVADALTEKLSARALENTSDALPLKSIALWLELSGDQDRSALFTNLAKRINAKTAPRQEPLMPEIELVSFE